MSTLHPPAQSRRTVRHGGRRLWLAGLLPVALVTITARATEPVSSSKSSSTTTTGPKPGVSVTQKGRGKLFVRDDSFDFGHMAQGTRVVHSYVIQNVGTDTLFIERVQSTCGCTSAPPVKDRLAPNEQIPVDITFNSGKFSGPVRKTLNIVTSDADHPMFSVELSANVGPLPPGLGIVPETGAGLVRSAAGAPQASKVALTNLSPRPAALKIVATAPGFLEARLSASRVEPRQSADLIVSTDGSTPVGRFYGSVTLQIEGEKSTRVSIPVSGDGTAK